MKIAFLSPFYPYRGGIASFGDSLYLELIKSNDLFAINYKRQYPRFLFPGSTQYVSASDKDRMINSVRIIDSINPFSWNKVSHAINEYGADICMMSYWMPFFAPALGYIASDLMKYKMKTVGLLHNVISHEKMPFQQKLARYFLSKCSSLIVLNKKAAGELEQILPEVRYEVLFHPFYDHYGNRISRNEALRSLNLIEDKKVILFFGFIRDYKGLDILIEAMKFLDESYTLIIAGEVYGNFRKYDELIRKLKISERIVKHLRYIPESEIPIFFSAADVCVLPYRSATQSGITGMAYHFDLPVIVTDKGGLGEDVINMKTGIVTEANAERISDVIKKYFNENMKSKFITEIKDYRMKRSWQSFAERLISFLEKL